MDLQPLNNLQQFVDFAQLGTNALLIIGMGVLWRKLNEVLNQKDEALQNTIAILREMADLDRK